jgi:HlyD family secretion protein
MRIQNARISDRSELLQPRLESVGSRARGALMIDKAATDSQGGVTGTMSQVIVMPRPGEVTELAAHLPVPVAIKNRRRWPKIFVSMLIAFVAIGGSVFYWWNQVRDQVPAGIAWSNGRIEADEIDIDTKFAGRIAQLRVNEGDMVSAGQVIALMDVKDLEATLKRSEAQVLQAQRVVDEARAAQEQQRTQVALAKQQLERTSYLVERGNATNELLDQRRQQLDSATAGLDAATARVAQAEHALSAAQEAVELTKVNIADNTLVAPRDGRIQYRIANVGEVLAPGGRVFTMIDIASVYMDIFLPTLEAGRVRAGADSRIVLDAFPNRVLPAKVSFIATQSQFTPKMVETRSERDRLMFRVRVRIDPDLLRAHAQDVRSGLPGLAFVLADANVQWPARLQTTVTK